MTPDETLGNQTEGIAGAPPQAYCLKGVLSFSRREHSFGPYVMEHGTLYFVTRGKVYFEFGGGPSGTVQANQFLWAPPHTARKFWTDADGVHEHALLLEEATECDRQSLLLRLPAQPTISHPVNPSYIQTVFRTAEQCWLQVGAADQVEVNGLALILIAQWLRTVADDAVPPHLNNVVRHVVAYVAQNYHRPNLGIEELRQLTPWSRRYFFRAFRKVTGMTPQRYIQHIRISRALDLLAVGELSIGDVAYECGYEDPAYFSRVFSQQVGHPPSAHVRKRA